MVLDNASTEPLSHWVVFFLKCTYDIFSQQKFGLGQMSTFASEIPTMRKQFPRHQRIFLAMNISWVTREEHYREHAEIEVAVVLATMEPRCLSKEHHSPS